MNFTMINYISIVLHAIFSCEDDEEFTRSEMRQVQEMQEMQRILDQDTQQVIVIQVGDQEIILIR